jgi:opacity protein-like surface antigen
MTLSVSPLSRRRPLLTAAILSLVLFAPDLAAAAETSGWSSSLYLQQAFPKQTRTNAQIEQINDTFGVDFDTWDDVANLSLGVKLFRRVSESWLVGIEIDYSAGGIDGEATIPTEAGPARLAFEQKYSIWTDLMVAAHYFPCRSCERVSPFLLMAAGAAYEKDRTTLTLTNEYLDEGLRVDNDGWFPAATAGVGVEITLSADHAWFLEAGGAYFWGRLEHHVPAEGSLAPAPEVLADNDSTGPNYWIGIGRRFGAPKP